MKKINLSVLICLFFLPKFIFASVFINEVFYSPTTKQWIEVYNDTPNEIDLTKFRILDSGASSKGHEISTTSGSTLFKAHTFAILSEVPTDFSGSGLNIFKTSLSIKSSGDVVTLRDGEGVYPDSIVTILNGSATDGNSLQKFQSDWIAAIPTPGLENVKETQSTTTQNSIQENNSTQTSTSNTSGNGSTETNSSLSAHSSPATLSNTSEQISLQISGGRDRLTTVGSKNSFKAKITKIDKVDQRGIVYKWSFGDGTIGDGVDVFHSYEFPGVYQVVLNATYSDIYAVDRAVVTVLDPKISGGKISGGILIKNYSDSEINLGDWKIVEKNDEKNQKEFIFPQDTLLVPNKSIIFPDKVTGITTENFDLKNPLGKIFLSSKKEENNNENKVETSTSSLNNVEILKLINQVENKIEEISVSINKSKIIPNRQDVSQKNINPVIIFDEATKTSNTVTTSEKIIFEAKQEDGFVRNLFSWSGKSLSFLKKIFFEE